MASNIRGGFGKKKSASTADRGMSPPSPSYDTRPPKGYKTTERGYDDLEDDDDDQEPAQPNRPQRAATNRAGPCQYDIESEDETVPRGKGKGKAKRNQRDDSDDERGHGRDDLSRAVVRRNKSPSDEDYRPRPKSTKGGRRKESYSSDEQSADYSDRGRDGRRNKGKSQALIRAGGRSKSYKHREEDDDDDERITVERYRNVDIQDLSLETTRHIRDIFELPYGKIESLCERGKIRFDNKTKKLNLEKIFPLFPDYMRSRWEDFQEEMKRAEREPEERGGHMMTNTMTRGLASVSLYDPPVIGVMERVRCFGDYRCRTGRCRRCRGAMMTLVVDDDPF